MKTETYGIPKILWLWLWLWLPLLSAALQLGVEKFLAPHMLAWWVSENGPLELLQFLILMVAMVYAMLAARGQLLRGHPYLRAWLILAAVCCLYVGGEEISWGQWFFHWSTPAGWAQINDQGETNLHNTSSWLDQKPRLLLEIGVLAGGLLVPLILRCRPRWLPARFTPIYPPAILAVTAAVDAFFKFSNVISHHVLHVNLYQRCAEVTETYMYWFTLLYVLVLKKRFSTMIAPPTAQA